MNSRLTQTHGTKITQIHAGTKKRVYELHRVSGADGKHFVKEEPSAVTLLPIYHFEDA